MIFKIVRLTGGGTFGDPEIEGEDYLRASSLVNVWGQLGKPHVTNYLLRGKWIFISRTPKGEGYGIWEDNPAFDWKRDKVKATGFKTSNKVVTIIRVRKKIGRKA